MFKRLGYWIGCKPTWLVMAWVAVLAAAFVWAITAEKAPPAQEQSFLPADSPHERAVALQNAAFPKLASRSSAVIVACREAGLTAADFAWLDRVAIEAGKATENRVLSPAVPFIRSRLVSPDEQAAMVVVSLSTNFVSQPAVDAVERIEQIVRKDPPAGLAVEITGTAGVGRDYAAYTTAALDRTTWVTVIAVLTILIIIYRSPFGAVVPLVSIGASVFLAFAGLAALAKLGWQVSNIERIFAVVLLFGAGIDYALFWIARYRENLRNEADFAAAAVSATRGTGPAILTSAATTICGLTTLLAADLIPTQNAGRILAAVLSISLLAALTLSPALARLLGRALFWPGKARGKPSIGQRFLWPRVADGVVRYPKACLMIGCLLLGLLAVEAMTLTPRFDSLSELPPGSSSARGYDIARKHFSKGQLYPAVCLLQFAEPIEDSDTLHAISTGLSERFAALDGVEDVYSLDAPLGRKHSAAVPVVETLLSLATRELYLSPNDDVLRIEILIDHLPFSPEAMTLIERVETIAAETIVDHPGATVHLSGPTAYVIAVREITHHDQVVVMLLATGVIAAVVLAMIRNIPLTVFMLLATWLTYGATITLSNLFFTYVMGFDGLDWKVNLIVFVIIVAVGQDYNIFLVARLLEKDSGMGPVERTRRAVVSTGAVISSCGLIMAATLGSLWAGRLSLLQEAGFALALGILIDTFFVRPVLIPSFFLALASRKSNPAQETVPSSAPADG